QLCWRALILPQMEGNTVYNSLNLQISPTADNPAAYWTAYNTVTATWLCPSDPDNGGGFRSGSGPDGNYPAFTSVDPSTGQPSTRTPVCNYAGSFGDNYCGGPLLNGPGGPGLPWETFPVPATLPVGFIRIGWDGFWGTSFGADTSGPHTGKLRGFFDYTTEQTVTIASVTDGTSNTIIVGEVLPSAAADSNFWSFNGCCAGMTVPNDWNANTVPSSAPNCLNKWQNGVAPTGCRYSAAAK